MRPILVSLLAASSSFSVADTPDFSKIPPTVEKMIAEGKLAGGSVLIRQHGKVIYQKEFGHRDLESKLPMQKDTLFRIFSMTKAITSTAALMLCEEGKLSLDHPIDHYLPSLKDRRVFRDGIDPENAQRQTTVRDLLRHTSGDGSAWGGGMIDKIYRKAGVGNREAPLNEMIEKLGTTPLAYQPGERWVYGLSSDILAAVIATSAGEPFEQVIQDRILTPLKLHDTFYQVPADKADRLAVSYRQRKGALEIADSAKESSYLENPPFKGGGSGLVSSISDYARFLQMIADGGIVDGKRYLRADTVDLMRTNQLPRAIPCISFGENDLRHGTGFGLGFSVRYAADERWDPAAPVGEYGWGGAASTHYWISPKDDLIVVTMEQTMPYNWNLEQSLKPLIYKAVRK
ncbi:beta-lactamase family protein [Akkermansiaceae bacterium]|nr:beta-lactamase family protein [Akkermansiaceae bacterium]MDB4374692.1 beta-lactamase family protein [bacterium]MDB4554654.1 beta-lactamase family protein [Akkermansiaceae bacterium]